MHASKTSCVVDRQDRSPDREFRLRRGDRARAWSERLISGWLDTREYRLLRPAEGDEIDEINRESDR